MEETKWLTKGKIILMSSILLVIVLVVVFTIIHKNNLKKEYINFQNQLEYAAPNYLLKEKISLYENEWREIGIKDILSQKLVINKRASECDGYVIAEAHENLEDNSQEIEEDEQILEENQDTNNIKEETNEKEEVVENIDKKDKRKVSNNISYKAYISCKKAYKTPGYGTKPIDKVENDEETQTENDTEKPVIELFGDEKITLTQGDKYEELGAVATDNVDGDITSKIKITGKVDTDKPGEYIVKYTVSDAAKNKTTKNRTVKVEAKKEEPKEEPKNPEVEKPTPTPSPTPKPEQTPTQEQPKPSKPSSDTTAPVIIFNDNSLYQTICTGNKVNISTNGAYGYVARDNVDGNVTGRVKITGDTGIISTPGVYNLYYEVSDNAGNKANATKNFTVKSCSSTIPSTEAKVPVSSISVTPTKVNNLGINKSTRLAITIFPSNATDSQVMFESMNTSVATVSNNGVITGVSAGTTRIKIYTSNGKTAWCDVTVK